MLSEKISSVIRKIRLEKGMSQVEVADKMYVHKNTLLRMEHENKMLYIDLIESWCEAMGMKVSDLIKMAEEE